MDRDGNIARVKEVLLQGLRKFDPEVQVEQSPATGYLHVWVVSDAFQKYSELKRHDLVWEILERALVPDPAGPPITRIFPLTKAEFGEMWGMGETEPEAASAPSG
jgi:acid stress-induced BolA-like protein IbaG/YrbA